jgi:hypothetical protein
VNESRSARGDVNPTSPARVPGLGQHVLSGGQIERGAPIQSPAPDVNLMQPIPGLTVEPQVDFLYAATVVYDEQELPLRAIKLFRLEAGRAERNDLRFSSLTLL